MKRIVLLLLLPSLALAQGVQRGPTSAFGRPRGAISQGQPSSVVLRLPFNAPGCYPSGSAMGTRGEPVTVSRSTTATYVDGSGVLQTCAPGALRVAPSGALIEGSATNLLAHSEPLLAESNPRAGLISQAGAFGGFARGITFPATATVDFAYFPATFTNGVYTVSCFVQMADLSAPSANNGDFKLNINGDTPGSMTVSPIGGNVYRVSATLTVISGSLWAGIVRYSDQSAKAFTVSGFQLETGPIATSYIPTTGTAATRAADVVSVTAPAGTQLRVWTLDGSRSSAVLAPGTLSFPAGQLADVRLCKRSTLGGDCQ